MKLIWKFNIAILAVAAVTFALAAVVSYTVLHANARDEVLQNARVMMESANASGDYTNAQVRPLLETQLKYKFIPQSVPAFAATEIFNYLREKYPEYTYKEATLNPTNLRDRSSDWEADVINQFRNNNELKESQGNRETPTGVALFYARPIKITNESCLKCHNTPNEAPPEMLKQYGMANGFGWKMNEIIGAQVVTVPMSVPLKVADDAFHVITMWLLGAYGAIVVVGNICVAFVARG